MHQDGDPIPNNWKKYIYTDPSKSKDVVNWHGLGS